MIQTLDDLIERNSNTILATYLVGSRAYGTSTPKSDEDYRGIFVLPGRTYLSTVEPVTQLADERNNTTYYTLKRFLELAATANPNIIEMLFMPKDCVVFESPLMKPLFDNRNIFVTKQAYQSHVGYAMAQIKRAKGQNKWINNPQPEMQRKMEIKKLFYVLRPPLACLWIAERKTMPPTEFSRLFESLEIESNIRNEIDELRTQKQSAREKELARIVLALADWIKRTFERCDGLAKTLPPQEKPGWEPLDRLFLEFGEFEKCVHLRTPGQPKT